MIENICEIGLFSRNKICWIVDIGIQQTSGDMWFELDQIIDKLAREYLNLFGVQSK